MSPFSLVQEAIPSASDWEEMVVSPPGSEEIGSISPARIPMLGNGDGGSSLTDSEGDLAGSQHGNEVLEGHFVLLARV